MKIASINISIPFLQFQNQILHSTPRMPTVFELMLLKIHHKLSGNDNYNNLSLFTLFMNILDSGDVSDFLDAAIENLKSLDIFKIIDSSIPNNMLKLKDIELTSRAQMMLDEGRLPGVPKAEKVELFYDPFNNILSSSKNQFNFSEKPEEIVIAADVFNLSYPEDLILEYISSKQYSWANNGTSIEKAKLLQRNTFFRTAKIALNLSDNLETLKIESYDKGLQTFLQNIESETVNKLIIEKIFGKPFQASTEEKINVSASQVLPVKKFISRFNSNIPKLVVSAPNNSLLSQLKPSKFVILCQSQGYERIDNREGTTILNINEPFPLGNRNSFFDKTHESGTFVAEVKVNSNKIPIQLSYSQPLSNSSINKLKNFANTVSEKIISLSKNSLDNCAYCMALSGFSDSIEDQVVSFLNKNNVSLSDMKKIESIMMKLDERINYNKLVMKLFTIRKASILSEGIRLEKVRQLFDFIHGLQLDIANKTKCETIILELISQVRIDNFQIWQTIVKMLSKFGNYPSKNSYKELINNFSWTEQTDLIALCKSVKDTMISYNFSKQYSEFCSSVIVAIFKRNNHEIGDIIDIAIKISFGNKSILAKLFEIIGKNVKEPSNYNEWFELVSKMYLKRNLEIPNKLFSEKIVFTIIDNEKIDIEKLSRGKIGKLLQNIRKVEQNLLRQLSINSLSDLSDAERKIKIDEKNRDNLKKIQELYKSLELILKKPISDKNRIKLISILKKSGGKKL